MPYSRAVEERYRLQPADLDSLLEVTVTNVTLQGLETVQPVLHFDGLSKWLTLDDIQSDEMARATGSAVFQDWLGRRLALTLREEEEGVRIAISKPGAPLPRPRRASPLADSPAESSPGQTSPSPSLPDGPPSDSPPAEQTPVRPPNLQPPPSRPIAR
jgi:hypothetical protein